MTTPLIEAIAREVFRAGFHPDAPQSHVDEKWIGWERERLLTLGIVANAFDAIKAAGYAVVPIDPTEAMEEAARDVPFIAMGNGEYLEPDRADIYRAMISAAQGGGE